LKFEVVRPELVNHRPVEIFLGTGDSSTEEGHLVLIVGAEPTATGPAVLIADPLDIAFGFTPTDFDRLDHVLHGKWRMTWTNLPA
jgi:hypothetical protein